MATNMLPGSGFMQAFAEANVHYWGECSRVWGDFATNLADVNAPESGQVKLARFIAQWAGVMGQSYTVFLQAYAGRPDRPGS
jgi:hypothetical protein